MLDGDFPIEPILARQPVLKPLVITIMTRNTEAARPLARMRGR